MPRPPLRAVVALSAAGVAGVAAAAPWPAALLPPALILGAPLLFSARWRYLFLIFGGLATLQSSQALTPTKLAYLAGVGVALAAILCRYGRLERTPAAVAFRPVALAFTLLFALVALSAVVAETRDTLFTNWLRDAAPYVLFAALPFFALDMANSRAERMARVVFILIGLLVGLAFMIEWMERRNLAEIGLNRLVLSSFLLPVGLFCYAASAMLHGRRHQPIWIALCVATLSFVLVTGTRTGLIMLVAPVWITATMPGPLGRRLGRLAIILASGVALAAGATIGAAVFTKADTTQLTQRYTSIEAFFRDPGQDNSYLERVEQTKVLLRAFRADPIWGTGPGYVHYWRRYSDVWVDGFNLDTGAAFPTKFGLVGVFVMVVIAGACVAFLRRLRRIPGTEVEGDGLASYLVILGLWFLFGPPFEDKGTSFALVCLFTLCLLRLRGAEGEQRGVPAWMRA